MNLSLLALWSLHYINNPHLTWVLFLKNPNPNKEKKPNEWVWKHVPSMNHFRFMKINDQINFFIQVILLDSHSQYLPSHVISTFPHTCIKWYRWRFVSPHPSQCMCGHYVECSQHPKIECLIFAKVNWKLIEPKGVFALYKFWFASNWRW
jgi:hypothetical protein